MRISQLNRLLKECFDGARKELRGLQSIRCEDRLTFGDTGQLVRLNGFPQLNLRVGEAHWHSDLLSPGVGQQVRELVHAEMIGIFVMGEAVPERGDRQDDSAPDMGHPTQLRPADGVVAIEVIRVQQNL